MKQPQYPYQEGEFLVLGPQIFTNREQMTIVWKGDHYYRGKCQHVECAYCYEKERRDDQQNKENLRADPSLGAAEQEQGSC